MPTIPTSRLYTALEGDDAGRRVYAPAQRPERLVHRAGVDFDRALRLHDPHDHVQRVRAGDHHRRDLGGVVGPPVIVQGDEPVHERPGRDQGHVSELAGADLLLRHQPAAAEALRVPDDRVHSGALDGGEDALRIGEPGCERLLDQKRQLALDRSEDRIDVQVLVGRDDRGRHLGPRKQLAVVVGHEVRADLFPDELCAIGLHLGEPDEVDLRVARGDFAAKQTDPPSSDDGEADALGILLWHFNDRPSKDSSPGTIAIHSGSGWVMSLSRVRFS